MIGDIRNVQGEKLDYTLHPGTGQTKHIVVIGHGVTGNKDRPFVVALADGLAHAGITALRFSFAGNGDSEGDFRECTVSKEVNDLGAVLDHLANFEVCYVGHSMGGAVGVLRASQDPRIRWLVSLAGMVHTKAFADREFGSVLPDSGFMWEDPACPLSGAYMNDMAVIGTVVDKAPSIRVPWLIVHGDEDDVVPVQDSLDIMQNAGENAVFREIKGANHVFSEVHTPIMVETITAWVQEQFGV